MFDVNFYTDNSGEKPIENFIKELEKKSVTSKNDRIRVDKILTYIHVLESYGIRAGKPYIDHIEGDIWELRPMRDRIFFSFEKDENDNIKDNKFILLHHFFKKTQKTPRREIDQAKRNMKYHLERSAENE